MMKNFGYKKDGSFWSIWTHKNSVKIGSDTIIAEFFPFPTIKFSYSEDTFETDEYDFSIDLAWFYWELKLTRYWGEAYRNCYGK